MADVPATRRMEELFLNPTAVKTTADRLPETRKPMTSRDLVSTAKATRMSVDMFTTAASERDAHRKASVQTAFSDPLEEQLYWRGYTSDEEAASTEDSDTESLMSTSSGEIVEAVPARSSLTFPNGVVLSMNAAERQCLRARAVNLQPVGVGKPSHVSVVDIPASPTTPRKSPVSPAMRMPVSRLQKLDTQTRNRSDTASDISTPRTSTDKSPVSTPSTPATSGDEQSFIEPPKSIRRKPSMPAMRPSHSNTKPQQPSRSDSTPSLCEFLAANPATVPRAPTSDSVVPTRPCPQRTVSSIPLTRQPPATRTVSTGSVNPATPTSQRPAVYIPTRVSSMQPPSSKPKTKMIARGADERAPPLVLPPCPDDWDEEPASEMLRRGIAPGKVPTPLSYSPTGAPRKLHRRGRSISYHGGFHGR